MSTSQLNPATRTTSDSLAAAMELFWERGYVATSLSDLLERMQVSRKRIYSTYGSKEALFKAALGAYVKQHAEPRMACLLAGPMGLEAIESYLMSWKFEPGFQGCLLWNSAAEAENLSVEAMQIVRAHFDQLGTSLVENLQVAKSQGDLQQHASVISSAQLILSTAMGLSIMGKLVSRQGVCERLVAQLMHSLRADNGASHAAAAS